MISTFSKSYIGSITHTLPTCGDLNLLVSFIMLGLRFPSQLSSDLWRVAVNTRVNLSKGADLSRLTLLGCAYLLCDLMLITVRTFKSSLYPCVLKSSPCGDDVSMPGKQLTGGYLLCALSWLIGQHTECVAMPHYYSNVGTNSISRVQRLTNPIMHTSHFQLTPRLPLTLHTNWIPGMKTEMTTCTLSCSRLWLR